METASKWLKRCKVKGRFQIMYNRTLREVGPFYLAVLAGKVRELVGATPWTSDGENPVNPALIRDEQDGWSSYIVLESNEGVTPSQFLAFHRYVEMIRDQLAGQRPKFVESVYSRIEIVGEWTLKAVTEEQPEAATG